MHLGILQTDAVPPHLQAAHGDYPQMFEGLFRAAGKDLDLRFTVIDAVAGQYPAPAECDLYVITGSRCSVYDELPWIGELAAFVRRALDAGGRVAGICFGHQLIAHFFGGRTERAQGWAVGVHESEVLVRAPWLAPTAERFSLLSSHQDQVTALPPGAQLFARNAFCPLAGFTLGDQVITFQGHPEFPKGLSHDLMNMRRELLGEATYQAGMASLASETHQGLAARWILNFAQA